MRLDLGSLNFRALPMDIRTEQGHFGLHNEEHLRSANMDISTSGIIRKRSLSPPPPPTRPKKIARSGRNKPLDDSGTFCADCKTEFSKPYALQRHVQTVHGTAAQCSCDVEGCTETFKRLDSLNRHVATQHGSAKHICPKCGAAVRKDGLTEHMSTQSCRSRMAHSSAVTSNPLAPTVGPATLVSRSCSTISTDEVATQSSALSETMTNVTPITPYSSQDLGGVAQSDGPRCDVVIAESSLVQTRHQTGPILVPDSPKPFIQGLVFNPTLLGQEESLDDLVAEVNSWQGEATNHAAPNATEKSEICDDMFRLCDKFIQRLIVEKDKSFGLFLSNGAQRTRRKLRGLKFGATCALCSEQLGQTIQEIFQHARGHVRSHRNPGLRCATCDVKFLYSRDLEFHNQSLGDDSVRACVKIERYDGQDWVADASEIDRQRFIDGLRRWEILQLRWFLRTVDTFISGRGSVRQRGVNKAKYWTLPVAISDTESRRGIHILGPGSSLAAHSEMPPHSTNNTDMDALVQKFGRSSLADSSSPSEATSAKDLALPPFGTFQENVKTDLFTSCKKGDLVKACRCLASLDFKHRLSSIGRAFQLAVGAQHYIILRIFLEDAKSNLHKGTSECAQRNLTDWRCCTTHRRATLWYKVLLDLTFTLDASTLDSVLSMQFSDSIKACLQGPSEADPFIRCIRVDSNEAVQFLLNAGVPPDWNCSSNARTALHAASAGGRYEIVRSLLVAGARIDAVDISGQTALSQALANQRLDVAYLLISHGAKVTNNDNKLMANIEALPRRTQQTLSTKTLDANFTIFNGVCIFPSALIQRCRHGGASIEDIDILLYHGADPSYQDISGRTALHWACMRQSVDIARHLLNHGALANASDNTGTTALMQVLKDETRDLELREQIVELLVTTGADVNSHSSKALTPLMLASVKGQHNIAKLLLQHGAQVDAVMEDPPPTLITADGRTISMLSGQRYTALALAGLIDDAAVRKSMLSLLLGYKASAQLASRLLSA